jgi:hypothetical protein
LLHPLQGQLLVLEAEHRRGCRRAEKTENVQSVLRAHHHAASELRKPFLLSIPAPANLETASMQQHHDGLQLTAT